jgi:Up-frameshift suppressor 2
VVVLSTQENLGPSEEAEAEFAKELAKMVTDSSAESRKVDKKTALALWDSAVLPPGARKKRVGDNGESELEGQGMMNFTVITKRGNKQQVGLCFRLHIFLCGQFSSAILSRLVNLPFPLHLPWQFIPVPLNCKTKSNSSI